jgi:hypothetical protein
MTAEIYKASRLGAFSVNVPVVLGTNRVRP